MDKKDFLDDVKFLASKEYVENRKASNDSYRKFDPKLGELLDKHTKELHEFCKERVG